MTVLKLLRPHTDFIRLFGTFGRPPRGRETDFSGGYNISVREEMDGQTQRLEYGKSATCLYQVIWS